MSDNLFREVDEELRKDKLQDLWKRYGAVVIAGCLALVLGTAGSVLWRNYQADQRSAESARFAAALELVERGDSAAAVSAFAALADDAGGGYALVARFHEDVLALAAILAIQVDDRVPGGARAAEVVQAEGLLVIANDAVNGVNG